MNIPRVPVITENLDVERSLRILIVFILSVQSVYDVT